MSNITFFVPGKPVPKGRPRSFRSKNGKIIHVTPEQTRDFETLVAVLGGKAMKGHSPLSGPVKMQVLIYLPIPQSWSKKRKQEAGEDAIKPATKPDLSNLVKSIEDGINGIVYLDDAQIVDLSVRKQYSDEPGCWITVGVA